MNKYDYWSEEGRKAILRAPQEARLIGHSYVGSEHLLLALLNSETSFACRVLKEFGINKTNVNKKIMEICKRMQVKPKKKKSIISDMPFTIKIV